jgi:8-amino-7-oxononanoate synthase
VTAWEEWVAGERDRLRSVGQWRAVRDLDGPGPETVLCEGGTAQAVVSFASNDYLGLTRHPAVVAAAVDAVERWGTGAGAARLVVGSRPVHTRLEEALAAWKGTERAVLFPTGYAANLGVLSALAGRGTRVLSDERNHASIVDGCRLSRAEVVVYPHGDVAAVERALGRGGRTMVVSESVFSMDGDLAPVDELVELCRRHDALLVLDEAHAVLGPVLPQSRGPVLRVGTLSKALASLGGFVAGPAPLADLVVNRARPFIFTTASTPADAAAALAALHVVASREGDELRARLRGHVERLRPGHPSAIVPVILGEEGDAMAASAALLSQGLLVPAIRPPTVPPGTSRLRVTVSAAHTAGQVERLKTALEAVTPRSAAGNGSSEPSSFLHR